MTLLLFGAGSLRAAPVEVTDLRPVAEDAKDPQSPKAIAARIEALAGHHFRQWTEEVGLSYPPNEVELRVYKEERETEIWGRNRSGRTKPGAWRRIATLPVCAVDREAGTKLRQGDGKTPEGTYRARALYPSRNFWMWMKLDPDGIDAQGIPGVGSAFRLCLDYPSPADRARSRAAGYSNPGGGICLHGNCVTAGCVSFSNRNFIAVFAFSAHHDARSFGAMRVHISPNRKSAK
ncbi:MAG: L,D-transpeptidase family protein [Myxococcota bacterium]